MSRRYYEEISGGYEEISGKNENIRRKYKEIRRKYEVCRKYGEVQDGTELSPLYSLRDLGKTRSSLPVYWDLEKFRALSHLYMGLFTLRKP